MSGNEETEQLRESLRDAQEQLHETHQTLQQPVTMEPLSQQQSVAVQEPVAAQQPVAAGSAPQPSPAPESPEHTDAPAPANGEVEHPVANGDQSGDAAAADEQPS
jgi:hypothetical protein